MDPRSRSPGAWPRLAILALAVALVPRLALADWARWSGGDGNVFMSAVASPDGEQVYVTGFVFVMGLPPSVDAYAFASADGGHTFTDVSGTLGDGAAMFAPSALAFPTADRGYAAGGQMLGVRSTTLRPKRRSRGDLRAKSRD